MDCAKQVSQNENRRLVLNFLPMRFNHFGFQKENYKILLIGLAINIVGFILMIGGATEDPNVFNEDELFSSTRITISPILILLGYIVILYSIMKKPKHKEEQNTPDTK